MAAAGTPQAGTAAQSGGGGGPPNWLPPANEREEEILAPLDLNDPEIASASGEALVEMARTVGLARGYAMCRCAVTPMQVPEDVDQLVNQCAREEAGTFRDLNALPYEPGAARPNCAGELSAQFSREPMLEEVLRCTIRRYRDDGQYWLSLCSGGAVLLPPPAWMPCPGSEVLEQTLLFCTSRVTCDDGTSVGDTLLCDGTATCPDQSDEYRCFGVNGQDMVLCGEEFVRANIFCQVSRCGYLTNPPVCDESRPDRFICNDGTDIAQQALCDRQVDCPDETDERHCFR